MLGNSSVETWALATWQPQPPILQHPLPLRHMLDSWLPTTKRFSLCYSSDTAPIRHCRARRVSGSQRCTLDVEPGEAHEYLQKSKPAATLTHTCTHKAVPHVGIFHTHVLFQRPSHLQRLCRAQTCTHVDLSPETWSFKHMLVHPHAHMYMRTHVHMLVHSISRQAAALAWMLAADAPLLILT